MAENNPIEYKGNGLDQRNDLTGHGDSGKGTFPKRPKHVQIQQKTNGKRK